MAYLPKPKSQTYLTPDRIWNLIKITWNLDRPIFFDPCPAHSLIDGLKIDWKDWNFVNPPYNLLEEFVNKAIDETHKSHNSIMLLPSKTDKAWFHTIIKEGYDIEWIKGRLTFAGEKNPAGGPHFLVMVHRTLKVSQKRL